MLSFPANEDLSDSLGNPSIFLFTLNESNNVTIEEITFRGSQGPVSKGFSLLNLGNNNNITVDSVTIEENWGNNGVGLNIFGGGDSITVRDCTFKEMGWSIDDNECPFIVPPNITVPCNEIDPNVIISCNVSSGAIVMGNENDLPYTNILFEGNDFDHLITGCAEALTLTGNIDGFVIRNNTLTDNTNIGIALAGHYDTVLDCDFSVDPPVCVPLDSELNQARNGLVTMNEVFRSVFPENASAPAGIYCDGARDVVIERNLVQENSVGISIGVENGGGFTATNVQVIN